jgi:nephrocystin-3
MPDQSRLIRVFLSSTFRDFAEERDLLVRKVFPELRRLCRERQVELVEVDLRWGITEEEAQQGKVLPICLGEIDRARPYFMGFIGDRYGWVPEGSQYPAGIVEREPWLKEHQGGKSVTELEMLHGVLNNPEMAGRAFFYFRDSNYSQGKGGDYLSEDDASAAKLEALKDRIRASQFPVVEDYADPQALADKVRADLRALIEEEYPADEVPDDLTLERMRHEAYSQSRRGLYVGGETYFQQLDAAMSDDDSRPIFISGKYGWNHRGVGKTALVSNFIVYWRKKNPLGNVILHHLGASDESSNIINIARRLSQEYNKIIGGTVDEDGDLEGYLMQLPFSEKSDFMTSPENAILFVVDGIDRDLSSSDLRKLFRAIQVIPNKVTLIVTGELGDLDLIKMYSPIFRNCFEIVINPLSECESCDLIERYLEKFRKSLTNDLATRILAHSLSCHPLWLLTLLQELRVFGVHEDLEARLETLLSDPPSKTVEVAPSIDDLYEHVLIRIETDIGIDFVMAALKALWASSNGLARTDLLELTGMPPAKWAEIQNALDVMLGEFRKEITFDNYYIHKAVQDRYLPSAEDKRAVHRWLGEYFDDCEMSYSVALELFHHFSKLGDTNKLNAVERAIPHDIKSLLLKNGRYDRYGRIRLAMQI